MREKAMHILASRSRSNVGLRRVSLLHDFFNFLLFFIFSLFICKGKVALRRWLIDYYWHGKYLCS